MIHVQNGVIKPIPVAVVMVEAEDGNFGRVVPEACGMVWKWIRENHVSGAGRHISVYSVGSNKAQVGVELEVAVSASGDVNVTDTPGGEAAWIAHYGPYSTLGQAHDAIHEWAAQFERRLSGPFWEIYGHWIDDWNNDPSLIRTDVFYLLD